MGAIVAHGSGLRDWGSIPGQGNSLTPGIVLKQTSNMVISVRIDGCAFT